MEKRLRKSYHDRMICGVCGGLGEYFNIDSTVVRIAFLLFSFAFGSAIMLYIACAIVMPNA